MRAAVKRKPVRQRNTFDEKHTISIFKNIYLFTLCCIDIFVFLFMICNNPEGSLLKFLLKLGQDKYCLKF